MLKLIVLLCCSAVVYGKSKDVKVEVSPETFSKLMASALQCAAEVGMQPGQIFQMKDESQRNGPTAKKFMHCAFVKTGAATKNGDIRMDNFLNVYPAHVNKAPLKKAVSKCQQTKGDPPQKIFNFLKCYKEEAPVHLSFFNR